MIVKGSGFLKLALFGVETYINQFTCPVRPVHPGIIVDS